MGGKSKSQTTGYKYYMGLLMGLCHGPIDALLEIRAGDRTAWKGEQDTSGSIPVNAPKLFGGDEKEGGVVGMLDVQMGESTQLENDYLVTQLGSGRPAYRGILTLVFRAVLAAERSLFGADSAKILSGMKLGGGGHITSNNPYIKPWAFRVRRILQGWKGGTAWYAAKAPVLLIEGSISGGSGGAWEVTTSTTNHTGDSGSWLTLTHDNTDGIFGQSLVAGGYLYVRPSSGNVVWRALLTDLTDWTEYSAGMGSIASDGGKMVAQGSYIFLCAGANYLQRMSSAGGSWSQPSADTRSWAPTAAVVGTRLIVASNHFGDRSDYTTDFGVTWTTAGVYTAAGQTASPCLATDGTRLVVAYRETSQNITLKHSDDAADSWSSIDYTVPSSTADEPTSDGLKYANGKWVLITSAGKVAYSTDGAAWTAGTSISGGVLHWGFNGMTIVVIKNDFTMLQSVDLGANWTTFNGPTASDNAWVYWAGEEVAGEIIPDVSAMNPAHIVYECLTNSEWGMGYDSSIIDSASFTAAADLFYAEGLGLCLQWLRQESIEGFIKMVMDHCGGVTVEDRTTGLIQLKPLRGNYTVGVLPHFSSELGNVIELRRFERASITDTINEVSVSYTDVVTGKTGSVAVQNLAAVQASGRVISQSVDYPGLPTMDLALRTAMRDLKAYTSGLARVHLTVNRSGYALTPGDVIRFSWLPDGIDQMVLRIVDVDYGSLVDGKVQLECLEDVFGLPATTYVAQQATGWIEPDSTALAPAATTAFEAPFRELLASIGRSETLALATDAGYVAAVAARAPGFNLCYELYTRTGSDPYTDTGTGDWCPSGTITANITAAATSITLTAADGIEQVAVGSLAMLGTGATAEMVRVETVDPDTLVLTIARGCLDTTPKAWVLGTRFWAIDDASTGSTTEYVTTEVVDVKLLTRTSTELLGLGSVSSTPVTMNQRQIRPYPPGLLRFLDDLNTVTGLAYPVELAGALTTSWAHRDRLLQDDQIIDESAASIGPEAGTTYTVRYYQPPATLVNTESGVSGTSATPYTFPADGPAEITVEAIRGGFASWQLCYHAFDYYRYPRITTVAGEPRITDDGSARKVI